MANCSRHRRELRSAVRGVKEVSVEPRKELAPALTPRVRSMTISPNPTSTPPDRWDVTPLGKGNPIHAGFKDALKLGRSLVARHPLPHGTGGLIGRDHGLHRQRGQRDVVGRAEGGEHAEEGQLPMGRAEARGEHQCLRA
jgi:hypothetical protein